MAEKGEPVFYSPLPNQPDNQSHVVLYPYRPPGRRLRRVFFVSVSIFLFSAAIFFLWPSDPDLTVVRLNLKRIQVHTSPKISIDISLFLTLRVRNRDFFSLEYSSLDVSIGYRGRGLGTVNSTGGKLRARASSYVNATIELDGIEVIHDVIYLLHDLAKGSIPFDTDTVVRGKLGLLFFEVPLKVKSLRFLFIWLYFTPKSSTPCFAWFLGNEEKRREKVENRREGN